MIDDWIGLKIQDIKCIFGYHYNPYFAMAHNTYDCRTGVFRVPSVCSHCKKELIYYYQQGNKSWFGER
jgi:hypothetical protein